ncbi:calcium-dependent phosphotriesterase [Mycena epipterygia]|nr:calcium-dependent phosphotriesterase [Mycena epipterygia]
MSRILYLSLFLGLVAAAYTYWIQPILLVWGVGRALQPLANTHCSTVPALTACEKLVLHEPTGVIYLACSTPESRPHWTPGMTYLNASGPVHADYIATYTPHTGAVVRLQPSFPGLNVHGMDVVSSAANPSELFIYAVNHRKPADAQSAVLTGADSTVEIFKTTVGSSALTHLHTVRDPVIITPNDVVGNPDGESFFFTNDHASKTGLSGSIGYCNVKSGCKFALENVRGANGIARARNNDTFYVADCLFGGINVLERQSNNDLLKTHTILTDRTLDNLSVDSDGVVFAAGFPHVFAMFKHMKDPSQPSPSSALAIARNTGPGSFYGEKFKVTKVFEDDGSLASGTTCVVHDATRGRLFLHGLASPHLTVCKL